MKKIFLLILFLSAMLYAQPDENTWGIGFGISYPRFYSTDVKPLDKNYGCYASIQKFISGNVAVRLFTGAYYMQGKIPSGRYFYRNGSPVIKENMFSFVANANCDFLLYPSPGFFFSPYILAGMGVSYYDAGWNSNIVNPYAVRDVVSQLNLGVGIEWNLYPEWKVKSEVKFHNVSTHFDGIDNENRQGFFTSQVDMYFSVDLGFDYYFSLGQTKKNTRQIYDGLTNEDGYQRPATREDVEEIVKANIPREIIKEVVVPCPESMVPNEKKDGWRLLGLNFEAGSAKITAESYEILVDVYQFLTENTNLNIEIQGHTDNIGSEEFNMKLSEVRSRTVKDYLIKKGIRPQRLRICGYGESRPITANDTEEGRATNRRIEFRVISNSPDK